MRVGGGGGDSGGVREAGDGRLPEWLLYVEEEEVDLLCVWVYVRVRACECSICFYV